jgi:hypothetical protein
LASSNRKTSDADPDPDWDSSSIMTGVMVVVVSAAAAVVLVVTVVLEVFSLAKNPALFGEVCPPSAPGRGDGEVADSAPLAGQDGHWA